MCNLTPECDLWYLFVDCTEQASLLRCQCWWVGTGGACSCWWQQALVSGAQKPTAFLTLRAAGSSQIQVSSDRRSGELLHQNLACSPAVQGCLWRRMVRCPCFIRERQNGLCLKYGISEKRETALLLCEELILNGTVLKCPALPQALQDLWV